VFRLYGAIENPFKKTRSANLSINRMSYTYGFNLYIIGRYRSKLYNETTNGVLADGSAYNASDYSYGASGFPVVPGLFGGLKYQVNNKQGKEALALEFQLHALPFSNTNHRIRYTLDGARYWDVKSNAGLQYKLTINRKLWQSKK
jgi:hypothetical protein